jgi:hypothetical protein
VQKGARRASSSVNIRKMLHRAASLANSVGYSYGGPKWWWKAKGAAKSFNNKEGRRPNSSRNWIRLFAGHPNESKNWSLIFPSKHVHSKRLQSVEVRFCGIQKHNMTTLLSTCVVNNSKRFAAPKISDYLTRMGGLGVELRRNKSIMPWGRASLKLTRACCACIIFDRLLIQFTQLRALL